MFGNLLQMDVLGLGAMIGSLLFLAVLLKFLLDDRSFESLGERKSAPTKTTAHPEADDRSPTPRGSSSTRRAA